MRAAWDNHAIMKQIYGLENVLGVWHYNNNTTKGTTAPTAFRRYNVASNTFIIAWTCDHYCNHYCKTLTMNTTDDHHLCPLIGMTISK